MSNFAVQLGRDPLSMRGHDLYETPACATEALVRAENLPRHIWEPACGRGAIARVLQQHGHQVISTDLVDYGFGEAGRDFLFERSPPNGIECVVTNPPFKLADQFIRHALSLVPHVVVLLRLAYAEGAGRSDLIDQHLSRIWLGRERLPMMHRDGWDGPKTGNSGAPFGWFVFERRPLIAGAIIVRRMSWRDGE